MIKKLLCFLTIFVCTTRPDSFGQQVLAKGDAVDDLPIKKILNGPAGITSFGDFEKRLTIVDFFGTWCAPCLRALPHLNEIRQQFKNEVNVILVSNETEAQLTKFINARPNFSFPVIVDENNQWNNLFQPPTLPYTAVVNKEGKVVEVTTAEAITGTAIQKWLSGSGNLTNSTNKAAKTQSNENTMSPNSKSANPILQLSQDYVYSSKIGDPLAAVSSGLKNLDYKTLVKTLATDDLKKAFWINIYNGYTQSALKANPSQYKSRNAFFKKKQVNIAGRTFSLDDIEHGILRRSKIKWSLGYFNKMFPKKAEKELRVAKVDHRVHFALNCGAKSCPPIAFYNPAVIDQQLDIAKKAYLSGEAEYDSSTNILQLPAIMSWFRADFGGKKGMIAMVKKLGIIPDEVHPKIKFKKYDWTLTLNNYTTYD